jgi:tetratricopeptide (TPR) repeat protein
MNKSSLTFIFILAVIKCHSQSDSVLYKQARMFFENSDLDKACELYTKIISINPNYLKSYQDRGTIYLITKKTKLAFQDFSSALRLDSIDPMSNDRIGLYYTDKKRLNKALYYFNKSISYDSSFIPGYSHRGVLYIDLKQYQKAEQDLSKVLESQKRSATDYYNLGRLYSYKLKKHNEAIELLSKCIELEPTYKEAYQSRANAFAMINDWTKYDLDMKKIKQLTKTPKYHY